MYNSRATDRTISMTGRMLRRFLPTATAAATASIGARPAARVAAAAALPSSRRALSSSGGESKSGDAPSAESGAREKRMEALLKDKLQATRLVVEDISGGFCFVVKAEFDWIY